MVQVGADIDEFAPFVGRKNDVFLWNPRTKHPDLGFEEPVSLASDELTGSDNELNDEKQTVFHIV